MKTAARRIDTSQAPCACKLQMVNLNRFVKKFLLQLLTRNIAWVCQQRAGDFTKTGTNVPKMPLISRRAEAGLSCREEAEEVLSGELQQCDPFVEKRIDPVHACNE